MGLETGTYVDDLVVTNPVGAADSVSQGDDHLRLIKNVLKNTFPGMTGAGKRTLVDSGAGGGPLWTDFRDSASPAANDPLATRAFTGRNSAAAEVTYAYYHAAIADPTAGSEDGIFNINTIVNGVDTHQASFTGGGLLFPATRGVGWVGGYTAVGASATRQNLNVNNWSFHGQVDVPANTDYIVALRPGFNGKIIETTCQLVAGTGFATFNITSVNISGASHTLSPTITTIARNDPFLAADYINCILSSMSGGLKFRYSVTFTRD